MTQFYLSLLEPNEGDETADKKISTMEFLNESRVHAGSVKIIVEETHFHVVLNNPEATATIFHCDGPLHLIYAVTKTIMDHLTADDEDYMDAFIDQDGNKRMLPLSY